MGIPLALSELAKGRRIAPDGSLFAPARIAILLALSHA
jgi:hypothetical protein